MSANNGTTLIIGLMLLFCVFSASSGAAAYFMPTTIETIIQSVSTTLGGDGGGGDGGGGDSGDGTVTDPADDEENYSYIPALYSGSEPRYWFKNAEKHKIVWEGVVIAEFVDNNYDFLNGGSDISYYEKGGYAYHRGVGSGAGDGTYNILRTTPYPSKDQPDVTDVTATDTDTGGGTTPPDDASAQVDADASPDTDIGDYTKYKYVSLNANSDAAYYWSKILNQHTIHWNGENIASGASLPTNTIRYEKDGYAYHFGEFQGSYTYSILKTALS